MRVSSFLLPFGDLGIYATAWSMRSLARSGAIDPLVRRTALLATDGVSGRNGTRQAIAIRQWLSETVEFTRDPSGTELLHTPRRMLLDLARTGRIAVDCDDAAILAAALGQSIGLHARFVVVGFRSPRSVLAPYRHVWAELRGPRGARWIEQDVTRAAQRIPVSRIARRFTLRG